MSIVSSLLHGNTGNVRRLTFHLMAALITAILLIPAQSAFSDDADDLLLCIPAIIAGSPGWVNTKLSHPVPLTYNGYDDDLRQCRVVQVEDGYWIAYSHYAITNIERRLFILKTNLEGRTMIPPFQIATVTRSDEAASYYRFAIVPREEGGVQVLTTEWDGVSTNNPAILNDYVLDRQGKITRSRPVMTEGDSYSADQFHSLWAVRTADGRTVFAAFSDGALVYGVYTDSGDVQTWEAVPDTFDPDYFAAHYDAALNRLYLMYSHYYASANSTYMTRWDLNGTRDIQRDLSGQIGSVSAIYSYQLMPTPEGLLVSLPNYVNTYRFFLMNPDCTIKKQVTVNGLVVNTPSIGHRVTLDDRDAVRLAWRGTGTHAVLYYAVFSLSGRLLVPAMKINPDGTDVAMHPNIFVDGRRTTFFCSVDWAPDGGYRRLFCRHMGFEFTAGQPDLVVSVPHILQSPDYATLDAEIAFRVLVFNRGEAASTAATVTLGHNGETFSEPVGALAPGASQELEFLDIPTPPYLTALPVVTLDLTNKYWTGNNHVDTIVKYPGRTPVYPAGSTLYTWTVRDKVSHVPLQYAQVITTLSNIQTADGDFQDVVLLNESNSAGQVTTRLPAGTYSFQVSRHGYPSEAPVVNVPYPPSPYFDLEPPGTVTLTFEDSVSSGVLHPAPNRVRLDIEEDSGDYQYNASGSEAGLVLNEVMPGDYAYSVKAFGYAEATGSFTVAGGQNNPYKIILTPVSRGSVSGDTNPGTVDVDLEGTVIGSMSDASGAFTLEDIPYGTYRIVCAKAGYGPVAGQITVNTPAQDLGAFNLPAVTEADDLLGHWTTSAWNRIDEVPGTFFTPNYKVTTSFGVFDFFGRMFYSTTGTAADFYSVYLEINGRKWYYYSVSTEFSLLDIAFSGLDNIVDGAGDMASLIVDETDGGFFDFLELNPGLGGSGGTTLVRVDSVCLYDGATDTVLFDSHDNFRQDYSFNGPMGYAIGVHTGNIREVMLRIYLKVMNENFGIGPLYLMDKFRMEWRWENDHFVLKEVIQNPPYYPSFSGP